MTVVAEDETPGELWGTTVDDVLALVHTVSIDMGNNKTQRGEVIREGTTYLTKAMVEQWIRQVASRVTARLYRFLSVRDDSKIRTSVIASARDVVANGAASYVYAAAAPEKASMVDSTSYSEVLWQRFLDGLEALAKTVDDWLTDNPDETDDPTAGLIVSGRFPPPFIRDGMRW